MCGIAGIVGPSVGDERLLGDAIAHRGPDDQGIWCDRDAGVGFSHRRLAIVDVSAAGHQPMVSRSGRYVLNYNGEIYNHKALRAEIEALGVSAGWRGHSDSETLLECIAVWGLESTLAKCVGMFAMALWDRETRRLHLVRDRFGEKPLYYGWVGDDFAFGSELKAMRALPRFDNAVNRDAAALLMCFGHVPAPHSIFRRIYKLEPGCILVATPDQLRTPLDDPSALTKPYWAYRDVVLAGLADPIGDDREAADRLALALDDAVRGQVVADVPVGAFLSGGIDSSTIVAFYRRHAPVKTFTVGFEDSAFDEAAHARQVADRLGTDHHEIRVTVAEAQNVIPLLPRMYDEPFGDSSQIPTYLVSKFARSHVKVALSGDGGDELFGGYNRYLAAPRLWARVSRLPAALRQPVVAALGHIPAGAWNSAADLLGRRSRQPEFGARVHKASAALAHADGVDDLHLSLIDEWHGAQPPIIGARIPSPALPQSDLRESLPDAAHMMYRDAIGYLPGDILCKVDRAAMAVSLETRVPFLDHRVAGIAARIPASRKIVGGIGKRPLRELLFRDVPSEFFARPKTGFAIPVGEWIKGSLRPWAEELISPTRLRQGGYFDVGRVRRRWEEHVSGRRDSTPALWYILMFQSWLAEN